ncbi:MAG: fatty acid desaturase [Anaerolineales bacterium]|nr:fatty acid desaturase [Anaerolineales bacterium]
MNRVDYLAGVSPKSAAKHRLITLRLIGETWLLFAGLAMLANYLGPRAAESWSLLGGYGLILLGQGLLLQRIYIVAHEAAHKKIVPYHLRLNDTLGQAVLLPILVPLQIYRKIHSFHHGFNRKDHHTSALDVFVSPWPVTPFIRGVCYLLWFLGVFAGGWFLHSLASIVIFLCLPTGQAQKISPAFKNWQPCDRLIAWGQFLAGLAFHAMIAWLFGWPGWLFTLGLPLLSFAWVWSLLVYIFHYQTTIGAQVRFNVRAIEGNRFFTWLLMNFNEHATHHMYPNIPWYELPLKRQDLPRPFDKHNQDVHSIWQAIWNQLGGPNRGLCG